MSFNFATLEPSIRRILSAPGTDLRTISAKSVRKHLLDVQPSLTAEFIKTEKKAIDDVIGKVFGEISAEVGGVEPLVKEEGSESREPSKRKRESSEGNVYNGEEDEAEEDGLDDEEQSDAAPSAPKKAKKLKKENLMSDAELARQLQSEINGRSRRSTATNGTAKKAGRKKKSAALVETDNDSSDGGESRKKSKPKRNSGGAKGGFAKEYALSEPLAALLEVEKLSRPQVVKKLWVYIKQRELQNPSNKREIICDGGLKAIFNVDKIDMFKMNKVLGQHLREDDEQ